MSIVRYETVTVNTVTSTVSEIGEQSSTVTTWFTTGAQVSSVANSLKITERYRVYNDLINFTFNLTPNIQTIADNQAGYSITYKGDDWRISDVRPSNDKMSMLMLCYRNDPVVPV